MIAGGGNQISDTAQIGDGVIVNADINASAAIAGSKLQALSVGANAGVIPSTGVADAHVSSSAAIAGSKLQALSVGANAGVIPSTGVADAHVSATAAIAYSKLNLALGIVNADISGSAAIADSKLAQITTASKVSGAAITSLASLPAGAGVIPVANLPGITYKSGSTTYGATTSSGNQNIAHGLGTAPKKVRITAILISSNATGNLYMSFGSWNSGQTSNISFGAHEQATVAESNSSDNTYIAYLQFTDGSAYQRATITVDATNIILAWTYAATLSGTIRILWEAEL